MANKFIPALPHSSVHISSVRASSIKTDSDTIIKPGQKESADLDTPWHVIIFNDPVTS